MAKKILTLNFLVNSIFFCVMLLLFLKNSLGVEYLQKYNLQLFARLYMVYSRQHGHVVKSIMVAIDMLAVQNLLMSICKVLGKGTSWCFFLHGTTLFPMWWSR